MLRAVSNLTVQTPVGVLLPTGITIGMTFTNVEGIRIASILRAVYNGNNVKEEICT